MSGKLGYRVLMRLWQGVPQRPPSRSFVETFRDPSVLKRVLLSDSGNFVVQDMLDHGGTQDKLAVMNLIYDNLRRLTAFSLEGPEECFAPHRSLYYVRSRIE